MNPVKLTTLDHHCIVPKLRRTCSTRCCNNRTTDLCFICKQRFVENVEKLCATCMTMSFQGKNVNTLNKTTCTMLIKYVYVTLGRNRRKLQVLHMRASIDGFWSFSVVQNHGLSSVKVSKVNQIHEFASPSQVRKSQLSAPVALSKKMCTSCQ